MRGSAAHWPLESNAGEVGAGRLAKEALLPNEARSSREVWDQGARVPLVRQSSKHKKPVCPFLLADIISQSPASVTMCSSLERCSEDIMGQSTQPTCLA